ncbi:hypothetical protein ASPVEDRAFT_83920 [Aspergillus versicolor CBS 583.65]|uniref:Uncharacterized protein n=1 Tax=Aspergillus versicolor CBS 583.65 TaxID=1036611 RepID=A0A1L9PLW8_ASPVE|nr:uncharacterized protein ASPVEDRAFT_83920 [Aspergillus versicolor CBS 583.65]OJJ02415.1 hypothetical protein ASPVEDRAFT_83920 [Aspergillus versicolor CBS 583.65]
MRLFNPVDSFDAPFTINRRQSSDCGGGGVGAGECLAGSRCKGLVYANQCQDTPGDECCLNRECNSNRGSGWCKNTDNQTCAGEWVPGTPDHYPCPGPNYVVCCVEWDKLNNSTSSTNSPTSSSTQTSTSTSEVPTDTASSTPSGGNGGGGGGLSASQKGGIAGGIVGAVAVTSIIFLVFFFLRRRRSKRAAAAAAEEVQEAEAAKREGGGGQGGEAVERTATTTTTTGPESPGVEAAMLASREKLELDASGRALHEMETPATATTANLDEKAAVLAAETKQAEATRLAELPGSLAVAEMPVPEENADKRDGEPGVRRD